MSLLGVWPGKSFYETDLGSDRIICPKPKTARHHQVVIIGGGLAGLSTAWRLHELGITDIALCEQGQPGEGASGRNGGFVFAGYSLPNQALSKQAGLEEGQTLHGWTRQAVRTVRQRIESLQIDCQANDSGVLLTDWFGDDDALLAFQQAMQDDLGFPLTFIDRPQCRQLIQSQRYGSALHEPGSFHFQPLRYVNGLVKALLAEGVEIYGQSPIESLERITRNPSNGHWRLITDSAVLSADEVVITTGGYDTRLWPRLGRAIQPIATYIATTEPLGDRIHALLPKGHAIYDTRFAFDYYRPLPDTRLLWGGRISIQARKPRAIEKVLRRDLTKVFPELGEVHFDHAWGGWMGYTRHQMPLLGQDPSGLWHATGFGGHGMAPTTLAGDVVAEAITGNRDRLQAFQRWQPVWAGGLAGRAWAQGTYWAYQLKDAWRDWAKPSRRPIG